MGGIMSCSHVQVEKEWEMVLVRDETMSDPRGSERVRLLLVILAMATTER
jgi:hypothetical protein